MFSASSFPFTPICRQLYRICYMDRPSVHVLQRVQFLSDHRVSLDAAQNSVETWVLFPIFPTCASEAAGCAPCFCIIAHNDLELAQLTGISTQNPDVTPRAPLCDCIGYHLLSGTAKNQSF